MTINDVSGLAPEADDDWGQALTAHGVLKRSAGGHGRDHRGSKPRRRRDADRQRHSSRERIVSFIARSWLRNRASLSGVAR